MKFSEAWLREWVSPSNHTQQLCQQFTDAGLEVDETMPAAGQFTGVIVARIIEAKPHPDADKLQVCTVDDGQQKLQIVCGAKNARADLKVALATVGAVLPGDFKIKPAKLRGVASQGMLCSEAELGLAESANGILELPTDAPVGTDIREYLQLDDQIIDIDLTPNRGDCLSIQGLARELAILNSIDLDETVINFVESQHDAAMQVKVAAIEACPRYVTRIIKSVDLSRPTPLWLQEKLRRSGIRSINSVVDVINLVMLELGQPMHAFDADKLGNEILVRFAKPDEKLVLLDEREVRLDEERLVITDGKMPVALAGVMGGASTAVSNTTSNIVLESAYFNPVTIMGTARRYNAHSDSSHRFERGVDATQTRAALERATQLILDICGGETGTVMETVAEQYLPVSHEIKLRRARISKILGFVISDEKVEAILRRLGCQFELSKSGWLVTTPLHRFDLQREVDLIEELARIHGYQHIPSIVPRELLQMLPQPEAQHPLQTIKQLLVNQGYHETMSYSFIEPSLQADFFPEQEAIALTNPIAKNLATMRTSLWPSLVSAVVHNQKHQQQRVRLFEIAKIFIPTAAGVQQHHQLAGVANGSRYPEQWGQGAEPVDFYDVKADIATLLPEATYATTVNPALHPGQSAAIILNGEEVGAIGKLHPRLSQQLKIAGSTILFSLDYEKIVHKIIPKYQQVSKYPHIRRDLALVLDDRVTFQQVYDIVEKSAGKLLRDVDVFDIYQGEAIGADKKSIAVKIILQHPERTLVDDEVNTVMQQVVNELKSSLNANLRE